VSSARTVWLACLLGLITTRPGAAQETRPSTLAIDSSSGIDRVVDEAGNSTSAVILDVFVSAKIGQGFEVVTRPFAQRSANGEWNRQIWLAALRYERSGNLGWRIEGGLIPAPVGLANLGLRPHLNPTIAQPSSLFVPLPAPELQSPRVNLLGPIYPLGVNATASGKHWDVRAALIDTSPLRARRIFAQTNPPRFANVVIGGGVTPFVGLRLGASVTRGKWRLASEAPGIKNRDATIVTVESDFSFRYTKLSAEWVRDALDIAAGESIASGWFVQGQQTLTPRWFVASRVERMSAPARLLTPQLEQYFTGTEETIGYRLTPEITLRASHRARRGFGLRDFDQTASVSAVWWKRWM
jgi:hypothetical protein